jgi:hypothetical protein
LGVIRGCREAVIWLIDNLSNLSAPDAIAGNARPPNSLRLLKHKAPERLPSPVRKSVVGSGVVLHSNSERTQQYGANEREHGEHRQHIEPQGKVHVLSP